MFIWPAMWHPTLVARQIEWSQNKLGADTSTYRTSEFPLLAIGQIVKTFPAYLGPRLHIAAVFEVTAAFCRRRNAPMAHDNSKKSNNIETMHMQIQCSICVFMCVCYCVRVPQRDDGDLFYLIKDGRTRNAFSAIKRQKITSCRMLGIC